MPEVAMLLPHMLGQLILTSVARADALDTSWNLAEVQWTTDAVDAGLVTGTILVMNEGREAAGDGAQKLALGGRSWHIGRQNHWNDGVEWIGWHLKVSWGGKSLIVLDEMVIHGAGHFHRQKILVAMVVVLSWS